jgi:hypothetical protein
MAPLVTKLVRHRSFHCVWFRLERTGEPHDSLAGQHPLIFAIYVPGNC